MRRSSIVSNVGHARARTSRGMAVEKTRYAPLPTALTVWTVGFA